MGSRLYVGASALADVDRSPGRIWDVTLGRGWAATSRVVWEMPSVQVLVGHPSLDVVYAAGGSMTDGSGVLVALRRTADDDLTAVSAVELQVPTPCHLSVSPRGRSLFVVDIVNGTISVYGLSGIGSLTHLVLVVEVACGTSPGGASPHQAVPIPGGRHLLVTDLHGDAIHTYHLVDDRLLWASMLRVPEGTGLRHLAMGVDHRVYVCGENDDSVTVLQYHPETGSLTAVWRTRGHHAHRGPDGNFPSEILMSSDGRFAYLAHRGMDVITVLSVDGMVTLPLVDVPSGGRWPRLMSMVNNQLIVANERSNSLDVFIRDPSDGSLTPGATIPVPAPTCVLPWHDAPADNDARTGDTSQP